METSQEIAKREHALRYALETMQQTYIDLVQFSGGDSQFSNECPGLFQDITRLDFAIKRLAPYAALPRKEW